MPQINILIKALSFVCVMVRITVKMELPRSDHTRWCTYLRRIVRFLLLVVSNFTATSELKIRRRLDVDDLRRRFAGLCVRFVQRKQRKQLYSALIPHKRLYATYYAVLNFTLRGARWIPTYVESFDELKFQERAYVCWSPNCARVEITKDYAKDPFDPLAVFQDIFKSQFEIDHQRRKTTIIIDWKQQNTDSVIHCGPGVEYWKNVSRT